MSLNLSSKRVRLDALRYLRDGKVVLLSAASNEQPRRPFHVDADVIGHNSTYLVKLRAGGAGPEWTCTCRREDCPHIPAVQLVTGWPSAAAKGGE